MHPHSLFKEFCKHHNVHYVNDAAQSVFATFRGVPSLSTGKIVCMSFAENKPLPSFGTHGAILTDDNELYYKILHLRKHGKPLGLHLILQEVLMVKTRKIKRHKPTSTKHVTDWQKRRHEIAKYYDNQICKTTGYR